MRGARTYIERVMRQNKCTTLSWMRPKHFQFHPAAAAECVDVLWAIKSKFSSVFDVCLASE